MKRALGFAGQLLASRAAGASVNVHAHLGRRAWLRARGHQGQHVVIALDPDACSPDHFDYSCVAGLDAITLNACDGDLVQARRAAVLMIEAGARMVVVLHPALPQFCEFFYGEKP